MKIFITGSADGLGQLAAKALVEQGHEVLLHTRNEERAEAALRKTPGARSVLIADLADQEAVKRLAGEANAHTFDAVIHNAGVYQASNNELLAINTLAPYLLTALMNQPTRLIYLSSGMHLGGKAEFARPTYSDTKLHMVMLAKAVARLWKVHANSVDPGWVPTKMGGAGAPDDLQQGYETQVWLAGNESENGAYYHHERVIRHHPLADDVTLQDQLLRFVNSVPASVYEQTIEI